MSSDLICSQCGWRVVRGVFGLGVYVMDQHWKVSHPGVDDEQ